MSRGSWPWDAQSLVFYKSRRLEELQILTWLSQAKRSYEAGWVRLKNLARARLRGLEIPEARSDECLEDRVLGRLNLSYFTSLGGSGSPRF